MKLLKGKPKKWNVFSSAYNGIYAKVQFWQMITMAKNFTPSHFLAELCKLCFTTHFLIESKV